MSAIGRGRGPRSTGDVVPLLRGQQFRVAVEELFDRTSVLPLDEGGYCRRLGRGDLVDDGQEVTGRSAR